MQRFLAIRLAVIAGLLPGCLRVEPKGPTALVHFKPASREVRLFDVRMDGKPLLYGGVEVTVPAGAHDFSLRFEKESRVCNASEPFCNLITQKGDCRLPAEIEAGKLYEALVSESPDRYFISLADSAGAEGARTECRLTGAETRIEVIGR